MTRAGKSDGDALRTGVWLALARLGAVLLVIGGTGIATGSLFRGGPARSSPWLFVLGLSGSALLGAFAFRPLGRSWGASAYLRAVDATLVCVTTHVLVFATALPGLLMLCGSLFGKEPDPHLLLLSAIFPLPLVGVLFGVFLFAASGIDPPVGPFARAFVHVAVLLVTAFLDVRLAALAVIGLIASVATIVLDWSSARRSSPDGATR